MSGELSTHTIIPDDKSDLQEEHATLVEKEIQFLRVKLMETAMGTKMAVAFANIFMAKIEKEILRQSTTKPIFWKRFIDDVISMWNTSKDKIEDYPGAPNDNFRKISVRKTI